MIPDFDPPLYSQVNSNIQSLFPSDINHKKYENFVIFIIIVSSILGSSGIFYYSYTFEEPMIFYIECSEEIDEDNKNYNKSNPLNTCHNTITRAGTEGILNQNYPIRVVQDISRGTMIGSLISFCFLGYCVDKKKYSLKTIIYSVVFLVFLVTLLTYTYSVDNTDSVYVCPLIETTKVFIDSNPELTDKYQDFIRIDPDDCWNMFNYIPRWIFSLPIVSLVLILAQSYFC